MHKKKSEEKVHEIHRRKKIVHKKIREKNNAQK